MRIPAASTSTTPTVKDDNIAPTLVRLQSETLLRTGGAIDTLRITKLIVPRANYETVQELGAKLCERYMANALADSAEIKFNYDVETRRSAFRTKEDQVAILCTHPALGDALGLEYYQVNTVSLQSNGLGPLYRLALTGVHSPSLPRVESIYVYTDIAKHQAVGDAEAPLLGIIPVKGSFGERCYWSFNPLAYVGVNRSNVSSIRIMLRSETGEPVPFPKDSSSVICGLHFKRRKSAI